MSKTRILLSSVLIFLSSLVLHGQWNMIDTLESGNFYTTHFLSADTGFTFHEWGTLRRTTNGGSSWDSIAIPFSSFILDIDFANSNVGYAVGGAWFPFGDYYSHTIMKTTDGGASWDSVYADLRGGVFQHIEVVSPTEYYTSSDLHLLHSKDGGLTHDTINLFLPLARAGKIRFISSQVGYVMMHKYLGQGVTTSALYRTSDGGQTWQQSLHDTLVSGLSDFVFRGVGEGFIAGPRGALYHTTNGGASWQLRKMADTTLAILQLEERNGDLYAIANNLLDMSSGIYVSNDGGVMWNRQISLQPGFDLFADISIPTDGVAYALSNRRVFKNTQLISVPSLKPYDFELYPNPSSGIVKLEIPNQSNSRVNVYNAIGQLVLERLTIGEAVLEIDLTSFEPGVYRVELQHEGQRFGRSLTLK